MELDGAKILILEDEPEILEILSNSLQKEGATVLDSTDYHFIDNALPNFDAHIVICDQHTPKGSGTTVLKKAAKRNPRPSCILLTGFTDHAETDKENFILLPKPFRTSDFIKKIKDEFKNVRTQWKRIHARVPCAMKAIWNSNDGRYLDIRIIDISLKGAFIQLDHKIEMTEEMLNELPRPLDKIILELNEKEFDGLNITGEVRWIRRFSEKKERPCGFGILFDLNTSKIIASINRKII